MTCCRRPCPLSALTVVNLTNVLRLSHRGNWTLRSQILLGMEEFERNEITVVQIFVVRSWLDKQKFWLLGDQN